MANICENVLRVSGAYEDILCFDKKFCGGRDKNYHFDNLYPTPELSISDMCDWCKKNWGVKGNFYEDSFAKDSIRKGDMEVFYYFDTPWTGPELLIQYVSGNFKVLEFLLIFSETGNGIGKIQKYQKGELVSDENLSDEERTYWFGEDETQCV